MRRAFTWALGSICIFSVMSWSPTSGQTIGARQSTTLHETDDYRIMAMPLSPGQAIVRLTNNGILSPLLVVQPFDVIDHSPIADQATAERRERQDPRSARGRDEFTASGDLQINGTHQRIVGLFFDSNYMYAAVAGYKRADASVVAADRSSQSEIERQPVRMAIHVFNHGNTMRIVSCEIEVPDNYELPPEGLGLGPLRLSEQGGVECLGSELVVPSDRAAEFKDRNGRVQRLTTEPQRLRMRNI